MVFALGASAGKVMAEIKGVWRFTVGFAKELRGFDVGA